MAKILRTEQLSVDGDNIRLTATDGNLIINSVSGDDLTQITSTTKIGEDISSLAVRDTGFDADVSSLAANTNSVESMLVNVSKYGVYSLETSNLSTGTGSSVQTITLAGRAFVAKPTVTATLTGTANDPIIAVMISDVSETATTGVYQVTFQFSDELPATGETDQSTSYKLNILANVNVADQDLDTIVDSVDSDRDGDGVENSLDYDPDDPDVTEEYNSYSDLDGLGAPNSLTIEVDDGDTFSSLPRYGALSYNSTQWFSKFKAADLAESRSIYISNANKLAVAQLYWSNSDTTLRFRCYIRNYSSTNQITDGNNTIFSGGTLTSPSRYLISVALYPDSSL